MSPLEDARRIVADALHVDPATIDADASVTDTEGWDSIAHVNIMLVLEDRAGGALPAEKVAHLLTVAAIADFIASIATDGPAP